MREIRYIKDKEDWDATLKKNKYLAANFTATWCGPCKAIKPTVDELYKKPEYKKIEFVRIDTDTVPEVCSQFKVSSIPTFIFFEQKKEVDRATNNLPSLLMESLRNLADRAKNDPSVQERSSLVLAPVAKEVQKFIPGGFEILNDTINLGDTVALNFMPLLKGNSEAKDVFRQDTKVKSLIYTDADSQGLFFVRLNNISKVHSILIRLAKLLPSDAYQLDEDAIENESQPPSLIKVWANKPSVMSFDEAAGNTNAQNITEMESAEADSWYEVKLKYVRFQSVQTLNIFIDGEDGDSHTIIEKILLVGISGSQAKSHSINSEE